MTTGETIFAAVAGGVVAVLVLVASYRWVMMPYDIPAHTHATPADGHKHLHEHPHKHTIKWGKVK